MLAVLSLDARLSVSKEAVGAGGEYKISKSVFLYQFVSAVDPTFLWADPP